MQEGERLLDTFSYQHELYGNNKIPTCYKNPNNPDNIDLTQINCPKKSFLGWTQFSQINLTGLVLSIFKTTFTKSKPKEINNIYKLQEV